MLLGGNRYLLEVFFEEVFVPSCLSAISQLGCLDTAKISSCWERARDGGRFLISLESCLKRTRGGRNAASMPKGKLNMGKRRKACKVLLLSLKSSHLKTLPLQKPWVRKKPTKNEPTKPNKDKASTHPVPYWYFP